MKADLTLYAVFAHAESDGATEPAVFTFDENHQEGWNCTASNTGSYWLLDQGKVLTSPEVDLAGLSSIKVNMRIQEANEEGLKEEEDEPKKS